MRLIIGLLLVAALTARDAVAAGKKLQGMQGEKARKIEVDFSRTVGRIRPLHGVNCGPIAENFRVDLSPYFRELRIPDVRLCAPNLPGTDCVVINLVFPNWDADPEDPRNYEFEKTDDYIAAVRAVGAQPLYCLGYTAERDVLGNKYKKHHHPPKDFDKWANICLHIVRHYNDGWARGHHWNIKYWEVWNEPDAPNWWTGTVEQYAALYAIVARKLKSHDPRLKIGGPAICCSLEWLERFLQLCRQSGTPLDFCSWHLYNPRPYGLVERARRVEALLNKYGFERTENIVDEWSPTPLPFGQMRSDPFKAREFFHRTGGIEGGAFDVSALVFLQDSPVDRAMFYSGDTLRWGLFDRNGVPKTSFYAFKAFVKTLDTPLRVSVTGDDKQRGLAILAGMSEDRSRASILISNHAAPYRRYRLALRNVPWKDTSTCTTYLVDDKHEFQAVGVDRVGKGKAFQLTVELTAPSVCLLRLNE